MNRRIARSTRIGTIVAAATLSLSGCVFTNPAVTATPYNAADGTSGVINGAAGNGPLRLVNFLVVASGANSPANVIGALVNDGNQSVQVQLAVSSSASNAGSPVGQTSVTVQPGTLVQVGPAGMTFALPQTPQPPGAMLWLQAQSPSGSVQFSVPVVAAVNQYATLTPASPSPTDTATPTPAGSGATTAATPGASGKAKPAKASSSPSPSAS